MVNSRKSVEGVRGTGSGEGRAQGRETPGVACGELASYLDRFLEVQRFADYCPNGLQVEGTKRVRRIVSGVTASAALIRAAREARADMVLVHHGYFWRGEDPRLVGMRRERIALLIEAGINLFAYHLPLDAHAELGNNACFGRLLGWKIDRNFGEQGLGCLHDLARPLKALTLRARVARALGRDPQLVGDAARTVRRVAWCTGAAQDMLDEAIASGADALIS
ncbi:MAG: Nif3-like dinuclear metal center hexameric protein, partial [Burkholderiaceae bacterium]|nr:Nif3-like dinuclear metal center hexameric protein [Burkholderiaceae bacterium]